jgi:hypothetical protein
MVMFLILLFALFFIFSEYDAVNAQICTNTHPSCNWEACYCNRVFTVGDGCRSSAPPCQTVYVNITQPCSQFPFCQSTAVGSRCEEYLGECIEAPHYVNGGCCDIPEPNPTPTPPPPPPCNYGDWTYQGCGVGGCETDQYLETRTTDDPVRCPDTSRCLDDFWGCRPNACIQTTRSLNSINACTPMSITIEGQVPAGAPSGTQIGWYILAFYNLDNPYPPPPPPEPPPPSPNPKPIIFDGTHYTIYCTVPTAEYPDVPFPCDSENSHTFVIDYSMLNRIDEDYGNYPDNFSVSGYVLLTDGGLSPPTPSCVESPLSLVTPSCNVTQGSLQVEQGRRTGVNPALTANHSCYTGWFERVDWEIGNPAIADFDPDPLIFDPTASDNDPVFSTYLYGNATSGMANLLTQVYMRNRTGVGVNDIASCVALSTVSAVQSSGFWQTGRGDVTARSGNPSIVSRLPLSQYLIKRDQSAGGLANSEGLLSYVNSFNLGSGTVSQSGRRINLNYYSAYPDYDYDYYVSKLPASFINSLNAAPNIVSNIITDSASLAPADAAKINASDLYEWYLFDGQNVNDLEIQGDGSGIFNVGRRKIIVLARQTPNVNVSGQIQVSQDGNGFFMLITEGNISVSANVGQSSIPAEPDTAPANLEGIFVADGNFVTERVTGGDYDKMLIVHGTVIANSFVLQRDLQFGADTQPAEYFRHGPEFAFGLPKVFYDMDIRWKEVAP